MYQPEISYLHTNTEAKPIVDDLTSSGALNTLDVVVQYVSDSSAINFYEENDDDGLLDDPEDGKLSEELEAIIYGTRGSGDGSASEDHYFALEEDEPAYGQPDFLAVDRYFASLFDEEEEISYLSPLASLYKPIEYDSALYVFSPTDEGGDGGEGADFAGVEVELAEEPERGKKVTEAAGSLGSLNSLSELDLEGRLRA